MRLFIGIELSKNTKRSLENIQKELRPMMEEGRFAPKENLHLTLKFLGNCSIEDKNKIIKLLSNKYLVGPFQMEISEIGSFSNRKGRILWAGVSYNPSLLKLFTILDESLNELSFPME